MKPRVIQLTWPGRPLEAPLKGLARPAPLRTWSAAEGREGSLLIHGENLAALRALHATHAGRVTLAYMDPPFFTNRVHEAKVGRKDLRTRLSAFDDRWPDQAAYLEALAPRLAAMRDLLAPNGSLVFHVDPRTSHYA